MAGDLVTDGLPQPPPGSFRVKTFSFWGRMKVIFLVHKSKQTLGTLVLVLEFP